MRDEKISKDIENVRRMLSMGDKGVSEDIESMRYGSQAKPMFEAPHLHRTRANVVVTQ